MIPIYIVNFNTTELTNNCIKSIIDKLHNFDYVINIFDNSNVIKFTITNNISHDINVIDNTNGKIIDFNTVCIENVDLNFYAKTYMLDKSKHGSLKHAYTIDYIILHEDKPFILFDSDTELLKDIDFIDDKYVTIAGICRLEPQWRNRFLPFIQYFNVPMIKEHKLRYFDKNRIMFGNNPTTAFTYDTGCSFYEDVMNSKLSYNEIQFNDYIMHFCCGSWISNNKELREHYKQNYLQ